MSAIRPITAAETISLRHSVLWPDAPVEDVLLPEDASGFHFGLFLPNIDQPLAIISLFVEVLTPSSPNSVRFRKFACATEYQGKGFGSALLKHACGYAREQLDARSIWCDARVSATSWYQKRGMEPFGEVFQKSGLDYIRMQMQL